MPVLYPTAMGSPLPVRPGLGLTVIVAATGFDSSGEFDEAAFDLWERLTDIAPFDRLETDAGNCSVYTWFDETDDDPFGISGQAGGTLASTPGLLLAALAQVELAELSSGRTIPALDLPWANNGATSYATTLLVLLVDSSHSTGRGEWLGVDEPDVPYHVITSTGDDDALIVAKALGRLAGLADETGAPETVPVWARRRSGLNAVSATAEALAADGAAWDHWRPWRWSSAMRTTNAEVDGIDFLVEGSGSLMAVPSSGPIDPEVGASGFGHAARSAMASWA